MVLGLSNKRGILDVNPGHPWCCMPEWFWVVLGMMPQRQSVGGAVLEMRTRQSEGCVGPYTQIMVRLQCSSIAHPSMMATRRFFIV